VSETLWLWSRYRPKWVNLRRLLVSRGLWFRRQVPRSLWAHIYNTRKRPAFVEFNCRKATFQWLIVALGWACSPSEAQRFLERGEVQWRRNYEDGWQKPQKFNQELYRGWPIEIRWRIRYAEAMWPNAPRGWHAPYVGRRAWSHLMPDTGQLKSWHFWLDDLEHHVRRLFQGYLKRQPRLEW
jgi:hypothetical protein